MRKIIWALPALFAGVVYAAPITTPWVAPGGGISSSSKINAPNTTLDQKTVLSVAQAIDSNAAAASAAQTTANAAIPLSQKGVASGVASLDSSGNVTSPVNTSGSVTGISTVNSGYMNETPKFPWTGWTGSAGHMAGPRVTTNTPRVDMNAQVADQMLSVGGHQVYDSVFSKFYALPYGVGDNGGCVNSVLMTAFPGTGVTCGAGGWDAVSQYVLATNNPPWYVAGADFPDENGTTHTVVFTATGAIVRPALSDSYQNQVKSGMHVMTNIVAGPTIYSGVSLADTDNTHRNQDQQFYGNTLSSWTDGSDSAGTFTQFNMTGNWQPISGDPVDSGHIPSVGNSNTTKVTDSSGNVTNSSDASRTDALDQVEYSQVKNPALLIGTYIKHFTRNTTCQVTVTGSGVTDGPSALKIGPSRKCDEELDNWYGGPDYGATMHGLTIGFAGNLLSTDSYGLNVNGSWPTGIRDWVSSNGYDFDGDAYVTGSRIGSPATIGSKKMIAQWLQEPTANIGYLEQMQIWSQTDSISETDNSNVGGPAANGGDISYWFGPRQSASKYNVDGSFESAIAFNPGWSKNGIALCGINATQFDMSNGSGNACLTVDVWGNTSTSGTITSGGNITVKGAANINDGINVTGSSSLGQTSFSGNLTVNSNAYITNGSSLFLGDSSGSSVYSYYSSGWINYSGNGSQTLYGLSAPMYKETLTTPSSSTASCSVGQFTDDANYHYVCVATDTWKRVALSTW